MDALDLLLKIFGPIQVLAMAVGYFWLKNKLNERVTYAHLNDQVKALTEALGEKIKDSTEATKQDIDRLNEGLSTINTNLLNLALKLHGDKA